MYEVVAYPVRYRRFTAIDHDPVTEDDEEEEEEVPGNVKTGNEERSSYLRDEGNDLSNEKETPAEHSMDELEARPHSDWIKVEPEDSFDLGGPIRDLSDEELTDHEDLDDDHEEGVVGGKGWVNVFESTDPGNSTQGDTASTSVRCFAPYTAPITQRSVYRRTSGWGKPMKLQSMTRWTFSSICACQVLIHYSLGD
jgi:hypothetical protein